MSRLTFTKLAASPASPSDSTKQILYTKTDGYWYYKNSAGVEARLGTIADFASPPPIGNTVPSSGAFTTLSATGVITASAGVAGNASTATTLLTARNINGVSFNGSADITVPAAAGTLTGATLAAGVVNASLNSITPTGGTLTTNGNEYVSGSIGIGTATPRGKLHVESAVGVYNFIRSSEGGNGVVYGPTDPIPINVNGGTFVAYSGLNVSANRWGNSPAIVDAHVGFLLSGAQRNIGAVASSLGFQNLGYFTGTGALAGELGNATAQADSVSFGIQHIDGGSQFNQKLKFFTRSASSVTTLAMELSSNGNVSVASLLNLDFPTAGQIKFPITQNPSADANTLDDYQEASYTGTATGLTTAPTASISYTQVGNEVTINLPIFTGVSNATTFTVTGMPAEARPATKKTILGRAQDNGGAHVAVRIDVETTGVLTIYSNADAGAFTATGTKSLGECSASYTRV